MKEQNNIDKIFSDGLQDFQVKYDSEEVWNNIKNDNKKRKGIFWLWLSGLIIVIPIIIILLNQNVQDTSFQNVSINEKIASENNIFKGTTNDLFFDSRNLDNDSQINDIDAKTAAESTFSISSSAKSRTEKLIPADEDFVPLRISENLITQKYFNQNTPIRNAILLNPIQKHKKEQKVLISSSLPQSLNLENLPLIEPFQYSLLDLHQASLEIYSYVSVSLDSFNTMKPLKSNFSIEFNSTIYSTNTSFYNGNNLLEEKLLNDSNNDILSYNNQVLASYRISKNISISAGIEHMQIFQRFYWESFSSRAENTFQENAFFIENGDNLTVVSDTTLAFIGKRKIRQSLQKSNQINIPIGIDLNKSLGKYSIGTSLSLLLNVNHTFSGFRFNENFDDTRKEESNNNYFQSIMASAFDLRPYIKYEFNHQFGIKLHTSLRWSPQRKIQENLSLGQSFLGAGFSINYKF